MNLAPVVDFTCERFAYSNGMRGVRQTIAVMRALVRQYKTDPALRSVAIMAIFNTPEKDTAAEIAALYELVRDHVRYVRDIADVETIMTPDKTLAARVGDCDDKATLLACLLESVGYRTRFVVASYQDHGAPEHVFLQVDADGEWVDLDPTESFGLGGSPPDPTSLYVER